MTETHVYFTTGTKTRYQQRSSNTLCLKCEQVFNILCNMVSEDSEYNLYLSVVTRIARYAVLDSALKETNSVMYHDSVSVGMSAQPTIPRCTMHAQ